MVDIDSWIRQGVEEHSRDYSEIGSDMTLAEVFHLLSQWKNLHLPLFPTTTIGSFPQTKDIRINRNKFAKGDISAEGMLTVHSPV